MDKRDKEALDRHITGNFGEDQFKDDEVLNTEQDLLLLYSGGLDSTLLLKMAKSAGRNPLALTIDYGQHQRGELDAASRWTEDLGVEQVVIKLNLSEVVNSALTGNKRGGQYEGVSEWHVPGRNTIFLGLAVSVAESRHIDRIWYGANYHDRINRFPDCYQEWVYHANELLQRSASYPMILEAPLLGMRKETVQALAKALYRIDEREVHSGYD